MNQEIKPAQPENTPPARLTETSAHQASDESLNKKTNLTAEVINQLGVEEIIQMVGQLDKEARKNLQSALIIKDEIDAGRAELADVQAILREGQQDAETLSELSARVDTAKQRLHLLLVSTRTGLNGVLQIEPNFFFAVQKLNRDPKLTERFQKKIDWTKKNLPYPIASGELSGDTSTADYAAKMRKLMEKDKLETPFPRPPQQKENMFPGRVVGDSKLLPKNPQ